ncbi:MAG: 2-phospho-L-lactate guanylyltransferase [Rhodospirillales bacterium]|jgi:2-phospho-L-lactate/phosphoenolpyruvate guanylyltransferase|nr:2-phospho-L-lactate guanylyltransferase [Rhodospirillales bacterium]
MKHSVSQQGIWAVVPVKSFDQAKKRMSSVLSADERRQLSRAMLGDVLEATSQASSLSGVLVVTCEIEAMELAKAFGASVLSETTSSGLCEAVSNAGQHLNAQGLSGMISIPGDVPLVCADEIDRVIHNHGTAPAVTLVSAWDGGGTNALVSTPADAISLHFGENSFRAHKDAAIKAGLEPTVISSPGLELDLDTPDDLVAFLERNSNTRTAKYFEEIHVAERFDDHHQKLKLRLG